MQVDRIDYLLCVRAWQRPAAVFLIEAENVMTYAEVDRAADRIAAWLIQLGITNGDRVLLHGNNSTHFLLAIFGILRAGAIAVPVHAKIALASLARILESTNPKLTLADSPLCAVHMRFPFAPPPIPFDVMESLSCKAVFRHKPTEPSDSAFIIYTSGSTGELNGVLCGHQQILFAVRAINQVLCQTQEDRILCCIPFSFDYGLYQTFLALDAGAILIVTSTQINPLAIPQLLINQSITGFPIVPALAVALLRSRLLERIRRCSLRYVTSTGDLFPTRHIERLAELIPDAAIVPMYGLTECKRVSIMPLNSVGSICGTVGLPLPDTEIELLQESNLSVLGQNVGELLVRGPHVMSGYWRNPQATAHKFRQDYKSRSLVLHTGDLFRVDSDDFLYFLGRRETLIHTDNSILAPAEIEQNLTAITGVVEAVLCSSSSHVLKESIHVFLVVENRVMQARQTIEIAVSQVLGFDLPDQNIHYLFKLPRTLNGKIDRNALLVLTERNK